jgi:DNA-binding MarR family transcriptional regulator
MKEKGRPEDDALMTATKLRRAVTLMARRLRKLRSDHGFSGSKLSILGHLFRANQAMTATDLARLERLQPQSLTRIIADLDEQSLIHRRQGDIDRRQLLIEITQKGKDLIILDAHRQSEWLAFTIEAKLTDAERQFISITADLLNELAEEDDPPDTQTSEFNHENREDDAKDSN